MLCQQKTLDYPIDVNQVRCLEHNNMSNLSHLVEIPNNFENSANLPWQWHCNSRESWLRVDVGVGVILVVGLQVRLRVGGQSVWKKSPTDKVLIVGKLKTNVATAALVPDVGRTPDVWSHNLSWPRINFAHNEFLSLQWIYSDIDLKKKRKKYFWWENIFSIELVTAQIGAAGTHVTTLHFGQFRQKFKPFSKNFS